MKKLISGIFSCFALLIMLNLAEGGSWTANIFSYKPSLGARGDQEKTLYDQGLDRVDARLGKEIWVGDPKYGNTIQEALTAIGGSEAILRVPPGTHTISTNFEIPSNVVLRVERGAMLNIANAATLTINGPIDAGLYKIFSLTGTGAVVFGNLTDKVPVIWYGTDPTAFAAAAASQKVVYVPKGSYTLDRNITCVGMIGNAQGDSLITLNAEGSINISGGDDSYVTPLDNMHIILTQNNQAGITIKRRRVVSDRGLRITGSKLAGQTGQVGIKFDLTDSPITFCQFRQFLIDNVDYPIHVYAPAANYFNANFVGDHIAGCYIKNFVSAIKLECSSIGNGVYNSFGAYLESGTNAVEFCGANSNSTFTNNEFAFRQDAVPYTILTSQAINVGNRYLLTYLDEYAINPGSSGSSLYDFVQSLTNGFLLNRKTDYIWRSKSGTGWYGLRADNADVAIELTDTGYNGTLQPWRQVGGLGLKYRNYAIFYDSVDAQVTARAQRTDSRGCWWSRSNPKAVSTNYTYDSLDKYANTPLLVTSGSGSITVTLPTHADGRGVPVTIKKVDAGAGSVTVTPGSGTIDGAASYSLSSQYKYVTVISDGTNYQVIANN